MTQLKRLKAKPKLDFSAIGTQWQIDISSPISVKDFNVIRNIIFERIEKFDQTYSRFRKDSWVTFISKKAGSYDVPADFPKLISNYSHFYAASKGLFTPLIGKTLVDAGYDENYSLKSKEKLYSPPPLQDIVSFENQTIKLSQPVILDFGAAGKGYLVDIIADILSQEKIQYFCINAGGDILCNGTNTYTIGLEHPDDPSLAIGVCKIKNASICASAGNRRRWEGYHHTINPVTLTSPDNVKATWIVADEAVIADGLATCLFLDDNIEHYMDFKFEYVIMYKDNTIKYSPNFPGEFFTA